MKLKYIFLNMKASKIIFLNVYELVSVKGTAQKLQFQAFQVQPVFFQALLQWWGGMHPLID